MGTSSLRTYLKVAALWTVGLAITVLLAGMSALSVGFSDDSGVEGSKVWFPVAVWAAIGLAVMARWTASIIRTDHRRGGTASVAAIVVALCVVAAVITLIVI